MKVLDGKSLSEQVLNDLSLKARKFKEKHSFPPGLAVILVGDDPASAIYVKNKMKACEKAGFHSVLKKLPETSSKEELKNQIQILNKDSKIHGILTQLPLPSSFKEEEVLSWINPKKDADGLTLENKALLWSGKARIVPCTPQGVIALLKHYEIPIKGQRAVVVGRSQIVGLPMAQQLLAENATVTISHSQSQNLSEICQEADIVVVCAGKAHLLGKEDFKKGAVAIDVGIHKKEGKLLGDVRTEGLENHLSALSPVPGGVGPMTIAMLLKNCLKLAQLQVGD